MTIPTKTPMLMDAPAEPETALTPPSQDSFALMVERLASNPNVDVAKLEKLLDMQERILDRNAAAAFAAAFADLQADIPCVVEHAKTNNGTYAPLEDIVEAVRPSLQRHGFSLSHRTEWPNAGTVKIIGILTHREGHAKLSEFLSVADSSGNKNAIQGLGSAISYGRRYTTKDLLNIVTRGEDDDAKAAGRKPAADAPKEPAGFTRWIDDLAAVALTGLPALEAAWKVSKKEYRLHMRATNADGWERLKAEAAKVPA